MVLGFVFFCFIFLLYCSTKSSYYDVKCRNILYKQFYAKFSQNSIENNIELFKKALKEVVGMLNQ